MKKILTRLLSLWLIGATLAIAVPDIFFFSPISNVDLANHYLMVQSGTTQNRINVWDFATSISGAFTGVYVPWTNIDTGFNNTGSDTIIPSEAAIWNALLREWTGNKLQPKSEPAPMRLEIWNFAQADGVGSTAIGYVARALWVYSLSLGYSNLASGDYSVALWQNTQALWTQSTALWLSTQAVWDRSLAMWNTSTAQAQNSFAWWNATNIIWWDGSSMAFGYQNLLSWFASFALWTKTQVQFDNVFSFNGDPGAIFQAQKSGTFLMNAPNGVGINTNNPQAELDVNGTGLFSGKVAIGTDTPLAYKLTIKSSVWTIDGIYSESIDAPGHFVQTGWGTATVGIMSEAAIPYYSWINNDDERNSYNLYNRSATTWGRGIIHSIPGVWTPYAVSRQWAFFVASSLSSVAPWWYYIASWTNAVNQSVWSRRMVMSWDNLSFQVYAGWNRVEKYSIAP
jgi:hypothetical protein